MQMAHTPLHVAAGHNRADIVKFLLEWQGPDKVEIEAKNMYGETPLHMAAKNGCNETARMLLAHGAIVEARANVNIFLSLHMKQELVICFTIHMKLCCDLFFLAEWYDTFTPCGLVLITSRRILNSENIA